MKCSSLNLFEHEKVCIPENMSIFRFTYLCGQLFPNMNYSTLKTDIAHVSQMTAYNHCVKMIAYSPHVPADALN